MKNNTSIFGQVLQFISRYDFEKAVKTYNADKHLKGFSNWSHFTSLLFGQFSGLDSLRSITGSLSTVTNQLYHLGITPVKKSTLSYANNNRTYRVFEDLFYSLLSKVQQKAGSHKFSFKNNLYSIDSTIIDLCLSVYDWAIFRQTKGGIKLHTKLNHSGYLPEVIHVSNAIDNDQKHADRFTFQKGDIVLMDRGFDKYERYATYCDEKIYFVTRMKEGAAYKIVKRNDVSKHKNITSAHIIRYTGFYSKQKCPLELRKIRSIDPETGKAIVILTNIFHLSAKTISALYKERWQIEIFFKTIKQNLKIKSFIGNSRNAVLSQIWVAMIAYLLLAYFKFLSTFKWTVQKLHIFISRLLFIKKDLLVWLNEPFESPPREVVNSLQLELL
jgi:co-chaperonin GroES (HSP10)